MKPITENFLQTKAFMSRIIALIWLLTMSFLPNKTTAQFQNILKPTPEDYGFSGVEIDPAVGHQILQRLKITSGNYDILLTALAPSGAVIPPSSQIGSAKREFPKYLQKTYSVDPAGMTVHDGYIIVGETNYGSTTYDLFLIRTDLTGAIVWSKRYGIPNSNEYGYYVQQAPDFSFVACGYSKGTAAGSLPQAYVLRTTSAGIPMWNLTYFLVTGGGVMASEANSFDLHLMPGGVLGIFVTGYVTPVGGKKDALVMALDGATGLVVWANRYYHTAANTPHETGKSIRVVSGGAELAVTGIYSTNNIFTFKTTLLGAPIWGKRYFMSGKKLNPVSILHDDPAGGDLVIGGDIAVSTDKRVFLMKINPVGVVLDFKKYFHDTTLVFLYDLKNTDGLGHLGVGYKKNGSVYDTYVIRTDAAHMTPSGCPPINDTPNSSSGLFIQQIGYNVAPLAFLDFPVTKIPYTLTDDLCAWPFTGPPDDFRVGATPNGVINIFPNPIGAGNNFITVETFPLEGSADIEMRITDFSGRQVSVFDFSETRENRHSLSVDNLPEGVYFLTVIKNGQLVGTSRFVRVK